MAPFTKILEMTLIKCCLLILISEVATSFRVPLSSPPRYTSLRRSAKPRSLLSVTPTTPAEKGSYSPDFPYEIQPLQNVIDKLTQTENNYDHLKNGLSDEEAAQVLAKVGPNSLPPPEKTSIWELWLQQFDGEFPFNATTFVATNFAVFYFVFLKRHKRIPWFLSPLTKQTHYM